MPSPAVRRMPDAAFFMPLLFLSAPVLERLRYVDATVQAMAEIMISFRREIFDDLTIHCLWRRCSAWGCMG